MVSFGISYTPLWVYSKRNGRSEIYVPNTSVLTSETGHVGIVSQVCKPSKPPRFDKLGKILLG
jgi:hypothetical protein